MADRRLSVSIEAKGTLAMMARIYDIGAQYVRFGAAPMRWDGLPRTFEEYVAKLYGAPSRNWMPILNYGLLGSMIVLVLAVLVVVHP